MSYSRQLILLGFLFASSKASVLEGSSCQDDATFELAINAQGRYEPCTWIDINNNDTVFRRSKQCIPKKQDILNACPRACGTCCGDNPIFTFNLKDHSTYGSITANCEWVAGDQMRKTEFCGANVQFSCPGACGLCPTSSPTMNPTSSSTMNPTSTTSVLSSTSPSSSPTKAQVVTPTSELTLFFVAEMYTKNSTLESDVLLKGLNQIFDGKLDGYDDAGIQDISFVSIDVNDEIKGFDANCGEIPDGYEDKICNKVVGSTKVTYIPTRRRARRRLNDNNDLLTKVEEIITEESQHISDTIPDVEGVVVQNIAGDMDTLAGTTAALGGEQDTTPKKPKVTLSTVFPIVTSLLFVGLVLVAYTKHRMKKKANTKDLEEEDHFDNGEALFLDSSPKKSEKDMIFNIVETESIMFPITSPDQNSYSPDNMIPDCICGDAGDVGDAGDSQQ